MTDRSGVCWLENGATDRRLCRTFAAIAVVLCVVSDGSRPLQAQWRADQLPRLATVLNGRAEQVAFRGRPAVQLIVAPEKAQTEEAVFGILVGPMFTDGVIEVPVAGVPRSDAPRDSRGFVGISFRTGPRAEWSEVFYLRPLNARADDQVRRNHTVQYTSDPAYPWFRLREEHPGVYESYTDLDPDGWTQLRVEVAGTTARLYVNGAAQPALIVKDLKHGAEGGAIALWAHVQTDGYFGPVTVTRR